MKKNEQNNPIAEVTALAESKGYFLVWDRFRFGFMLIGREKTPVQCIGIRNDIPAPTREVATDGVMDLDEIKTWLE